jgi:hypothetical protein
MFWKDVRFSVPYTDDYPVSGCAYYITKTDLFPEHWEMTVRPSKIRDFTVL